jgi:hypothetical protein
MKFQLERYCKCSFRCAAQRKREKKQEALHFSPFTFIIISIANGVCNSILANVWIMVYIYTFLIILARAFFANTLFHGNVFFSRLLPTDSMLLRQRQWLGAIVDQWTGHIFDYFHQNHN